MAAIKRPSSVGLAMADAALKLASRIKKAEPNNWIPRRVLLNMDRENIGVVTEHEQQRLSFKTAQKLKAQGIIS